MDVAWVQPEILDIARTFSAQDAALKAAAVTRNDFLNGPIDPVNISGVSDHLLNVLYNSKSICI